MLSYFQNLKIKKEREKKVISSTNVVYARSIRIPMGVFAVFINQKEGLSGKK